MFPLSSVISHNCSPPRLPQITHFITHTRLGKVSSVPRSTFVVSVIRHKIKQPPSHDASFLPAESTLYRGQRGMPHGRTQNESSTPVPLGVNLPFILHLVCFNISLVVLQRHSHEHISPLCMRRTESSLGGELFASDHKEAYTTERQMILDARRRRIKLPGRNVNIINQGFLAIALPAFATKKKYPSVSNTLGIMFPLWNTTWQEKVHEIK